MEDLARADTIYRIANEKGFEALANFVREVRTLKKGSFLSLYENGLSLWKTGRAHQAKMLFGVLFEEGFQEVDFIIQYVGLLTGEMDYRQLNRVIDSCLAQVDERTRQYLIMLKGHATLATASDRDMIICSAAKREESGKWLNRQNLFDCLRDAIEHRRPMSFIRIGDGEAKFSVYFNDEAHSLVTYEERHAITNNIWRNWFGNDIQAENAEGVKHLYNDYISALSNADILGVVDSTRLRQDTGHYGYLAIQELIVSSIEDKAPSMLFCSSLVHYQLQKSDPYLQKLLAGCKRLNIISPHYGDPGGVAARFNPQRFRSFVIPGERRLPEHLLSSSLVHYPDIYSELLQEISVQEPGEIFLVAAGLLGKIYCDRIKNLGGIAIDIGSLIDGWAGFNTRPGLLDDLMAQ